MPSLSFYSFDSLGNPWVSGGGAVRDMEVLGRFAARADVTLYTGRYPGFRDRVENGVRIRGLGFGGRNWLCRLTYLLAANFRILFDRADRIVNGASIYAPVLLGVLRGRRHAVLLHHLVGRDAVRKYGAAGWLPLACERFLVRAARRYIVVNGAVRAAILDANPGAEVLLSANGFDAAILDAPRDVAQPPFVLFLGRYDVFMKGLDLLVPAWADALAPLGIDLVLAGRATSDDRTRVERLVPEPLRRRVRLETSVSEERKRDLLAQCLFFASPSRFEGFGIAALEANAAGVAVAATDTEGFRDSLAADETALIAPVNDPGALRDALLRLARDAELRDRLGRAGRERARGFSWDAVAAREFDWLFARG